MHSPGGVRLQECQQCSPAMNPPAAPGLAGGPLVEGKGASRTRLREATSGRDQPPLQITDEVIYKIIKRAGVICIHAEKQWKGL